MMRTLVFLISVFCVATVLTEILGVAYLWFNGQLTPAALQEIRVALGGEPVESADDEAEKKAAKQSHDDILRTRIERGWDLQRRLQEARILIGMTAEKATETKEDRDRLKQSQAAYKKTLAMQQELLASESTKRAQGILLKMDPADAVSNLMSLPLEENVILLKSMPAKSLATILQEFLRGNDPKKVEREEKIFQAISEGQPQRKVIKNAVDQVGGVSPAAPTATP